MLVIGLVILAGLIIFTKYQSRTLKAGINHYQNDPIKLRVNPVLVVPKIKDRFDKTRQNSFKDNFESEIKAASKYWKEMAGIEFIWDYINVVNNENYLELDGKNEVQSVVNKYYNNAPVMLSIKTRGFVDAATVGLTGPDRNGFAVVRFANGKTIAHEMGHVLISSFYTHVKGNPTNLMAKGTENAGMSLANMFLSQSQIDKARSKVDKMRWKIE